MSVYIPMQRTVRVTGQEVDKAAPHGDPSLSSVCPRGGQVQMTGVSSIGEKPITCRGVLEGKIMLGDDCAAVDDFVYTVDTQAQSFKERAMGWVRAYPYIAGGIAAVGTVGLVVGFLLCLY